uniref:OTU domain-containing protein n=1 Tax=Megaviridae environmental sample TaxID=1737588 RepID=A0A5J6VKX8_9VIRU|nr:MAG: hypothetical protein [Megaviridae environmental sample]
MIKSKNNVQKGGSIAEVSEFFSYLENDFRLNMKLEPILSETISYFDENEDMNKYLIENPGSESILIDVIFDIAQKLNLTVDDYGLSKEGVALYYREWIRMSPVRISTPVGDIDSRIPVVTSCTSEEDAYTEAIRQSEEESRTRAEEESRTREDAALAEAIKQSEETIVSDEASRARDAELLSEAVKQSEEAARQLERTTALQAERDKENERLLAAGLRQEQIQVELEAQRNQGDLARPRDEGELAESTSHNNVAAFESAHVRSNAINVGTDHLLSWIKSDRTRVSLELLAEFFDNVERISRDIAMLSAEPILLYSPRGVPDVLLPQVPVKYFADRQCEATLVDGQTGTYRDAGYPRDELMRATIQERKFGEVDSVTVQNVLGNGECFFRAIISGLHYSNTRINLGFDFVTAGDDLIKRLKQTIIDYIKYCISSNSSEDALVCSQNFYSQLQHHLNDELGSLKAKVNINLQAAVDAGDSDLVDVLSQQHHKLEQGLTKDTYKEIMELYFERLMDIDYNGGIFESEILAQVLNINIRSWAWNHRDYGTNRILYSDTFKSHSGSDTTINVLNTGGHYMVIFI